MKTPDGVPLVRLSFYVKDPDSFQGQDCPTFYRTDRGTWVVQGDRRDESEVVAQAQGFKAREGLLELPGDLVDLFARMYVKEKYGVDLSSRTPKDDQPGA
jgi:hypothetical protein